MQGMSGNKKGSQTPAAMQTVLAALAVAGLKGFTPKIGDATQAYLQSESTRWTAQRLGCGCPRLGSLPPVTAASATRCAVSGSLCTFQGSEALWDKSFSAILTRLG